MFMVEVKFILIVAMIMLITPVTAMNITYPQEYYTLGASFDTTMSIYSGTHYWGYSDEHLQYVGLQELRRQTILMEKQNELLAEQNELLSKSSLSIPKSTNTDNYFYQIERSVTSETDGISSCYDILYAYDKSNMTNRYIQDYESCQRAV
jgi:hypothetical protein